MVKDWEFLTANDWAKAICEVYGLNYKQVGRIVLDCTPGDLIVLYVTLLGDKRLLEVRPPDPKEVRIVMGSSGGQDLAEDDKRGVEENVA